MIDLDEFRRRALPVSVFCERAIDAADELTDREVNCGARRRDVKALLEEILPLAFFGRCLERPDRRVRCQYLGRDEDDCDGRIELSGRCVDLGFSLAGYNVEVTSAQFPREYLRREALGLHGSVFDDPDLYDEGSRHRGDRRVVSRPTARDGDSPVRDATEWVSEAIRRKRGRDYPRPCLLLVRAVPDRPLTLSEWSEVWGGARAEVRSVEEAEDFQRVFVVDGHSGAVVPFP